MKPVYQMTLGISTQHEVGLVFSSEIEDEDVVQSPIFVLPVSTPVQDPIELSRYLSEESFYFPGVLRNKLVNAVSEYGEPSLTVSFKVPETSISLAFDVGMRRRGFWKWLRPRPYNMPMLLPYVGTSAQRSMSDGDLYVPLIPLDVVEMDQVYREEKFAFVGLTPRFGELVSERYR